jgi:hypothetical protein
MQQSPPAPGNRPYPPSRSSLRPLTLALLAVTLEALLAHTLKAAVVVFARGVGVAVVAGPRVALVDVCGEKANRGVSVEREQP